MDDEIGNKGGLVNLKIHGKISLDRTASKIAKCEFNSVNSYDDGN
jgi:hypothetical protein